MITREEVGSPLRYVVVTVVLVALTGLNVASAQISLGGLNTLLSLGIASVEAILMVLVYMRLRRGAAMTRVAAIAGLFWLGILMVGTLDDVLTRGWLPIPGK